MASAQTDENIEWIQISLKFAIPSLIVYSFCSYYLILWAKFNYPLVVPLGFILLLKLSNISISLIKARKYKFEWLIFTDTILKALFIALLFPAYFHYIRVIFAGIPLYASNILLTLITYKNPSNYAVCIHVFKTIIQWSYSVTFICISLRYEGTIDWPWLYLFWPLWLIIALSCISVFFYIVLILALWIRERINILCPLWLFLNIFGISLTFGIFLANFCSFLNYEDKTAFIQGCAIFASYLLISALASLAIYKHAV